MTNKNREISDMYTKTMQGINVTKLRGNLEHASKILDNGTTDRDLFSGRERNSCALLFKKASPCPKADRKRKV
jgi:hypothetical protein